jgi:hypothetical protein
MLKVYKKQRDKLLQRYNTLLDYKNIFPIEGITQSQKSITIEDVKTKKEQLESEHFFVSFTGQIKAGKSTIINALLFGDEIVPADDTPYTAKITIIKYGQTPRIEATLYNQEEWQLLKENQSFYEKFLKSDIEKSIKAGVFVEEMIQSTPKLLKDDNFENLAEFVTKDGKYTPFVNTVTLYYPNDILKEITVVDTPGVNDSNQLRDRVTKEWIAKTNANIYITYANQAMDGVDIEFIDNFLLSVPKEQKLTVINKIDAINGIDGLNDYIDELFMDESLKNREILTTKENLVAISGLGALIDRMLESRGFDKLSLDLQFYAKQLDEKGFLEPQNHNFGELESIIEQKLIESRGENILDSHSKYIDSLFEIKIMGIKKRLEIEKSSLSSLFKTKEELIKLQLSLDQIITSIKEEQRIIEERFDRLLKREIDEFTSRANRLNEKNIEKAKVEIESIEFIENYKNEISWIIKKILDENFDELKELIKPIVDRLHSSTQKEITNLKQKLAQENRDIELGATYHTFSIYSTELMYGIKNLVDKSFEREKIDKIVKENIRSWERFFSTKKTFIKINSAIMDRIKIFFEGSSLKMIEVLEDRIKEYISETILNSISGELQSQFNSKQLEIEQYREDTKEKERLIYKHKEKKESLANELRELNKLLKFIQSDG